MNNIVHIKEKSDMILEPLQVMIQLSLLAHCPIGTKLSISDNTLYLQLPCWSQGMMRWYMKDNKDDLYYLFQAIRRYYVWYKPDSCIIYEKILLSAIKGLKNLIKTYENTDKISIRHTLTLYTNILSLESPDLFKETTEDAVNIDKVFENVTKMYNKKILSVVHNCLSLLEGEEKEESKKYIYDGLQNILIPQNIKIKLWIRENLTC
tara:strand:+ start:479 stop:1099 length:621 start_codon:yes stop_codon:yes gene_type:complete